MTSATFSAMPETKLADYPPELVREIIAVAKQIQSDPKTRVAISGTLAVEIARRKPGLKPPEMAWNTYFLLCDACLKKAKLFEGPAGAIVPVVGDSGQGGAVRMSMVDVETQLAKLRNRPYYLTEADAAFSMTGSTEERRNTLARSVAAGHSTGFENAMRKQRGTHGQGVISKMSPRQRQRYLEACDLLGECQPSVDAASVEGFVTMFSDFAKARAEQYGIRQ
jgi:hypothetical protein